MAPSMSRYKFWRLKANANIPLNFHYCVAENIILEGTKSASAFAPSFRSTFATLVSPFIIEDDHDYQATAVQQHNVQRLHRPVSTSY